MWYFFLGDGLLHMTAYVGNEAAALFLARNGADVNLSNNKVGFHHLPRSVIHVNMPSLVL